MIIRNLRRLCEFFAALGHPFGGAHELQSQIHSEPSGRAKTGAAMFRTSGGRTTAGVFRGVGSERLHSSGLPKINRGTEHVRSAANAFRLLVAVAVFSGSRDTALAAYQAFNAAVDRPRGVREWGNGPARPMKMTARPMSHRV